MRKPRFTDEEMVAILREADREPAGIVAKRHRVSEQTIYNWRKKFAALSTDEVRRLKQLEAENTRLKKRVVDRDLEIEVMKEIAAKKMVSVRARRAAATCAIERGLSQRRACTLLNVARSALNYCSRLTAKDAPALQRMSELSSQYPRYGYRRIAIFMRRDGHAMSFGRASRLWRDAQLHVPRKRVRKRVSSGRPRPNTPTGAN